MSVVEKVEECKKSGTKYRIVCYVPVNSDIFGEEMMFDSREEAEKEIKHLESLQSRNIYIVNYVKKEVNNG